ncbi:hypothetical protein [Ancylobacter terrae]|uniref:hypothetical protein n=1 Tax=Ancylobacter sp. sgz301288 TaxID=3342077 RepID=UPI003859D185
MGEIALIVGTGLKAVGSVMAGREQARAAKFEQQQYGIQAQVERTAAAQAEARKREELTSALGTIQAVRAGRGVGMSSPTGMATLTTVASEMTRDARQASLNHLLKADQSRMAGALSGKKATYSLLSGLVDAGADIAGGVYDYSQLIAKPKVG